METLLSSQVYISVTTGIRVFTWTYTGASGANIINEGESVKIEGNNLLELIDCIQYKLFKERNYHRNHQIILEPNQVTGIDVDGEILVDPGFRR